MIVATPLDIPKIEPDNWEVFWKIWQRESKYAVKVKTNVDTSLSPVGQDNLWTALDIYKRHDLKTALEVPYYNIKDDLPEMYNRILNLPFKYMQSVRVLSSQQDILAHTDDGRNNWSVRALLHCKDPEPQWYFTQPGGDGNRKFFRLPTDTNWFAYHDRHCWHGSVFNNQYPKLLLQVFTFGDDTTIINSSIEKYKDYVINL
jgi:hypothetical protein